MRIALGVEYNGEHYLGWQRLSHGKTIQATLEAAVSKVANEKIEVTCAGRTDAGVHAVGQVVHFDTQADRDERGWLLGTNANLPDDIGISWCRFMDDEFHARYSALSRHYRYLILNRLARPSVWYGQVAWIYDPLDETLMHQAAQVLIGEHDFNAFRASGCQSKSSHRNVHAIEVSRRGEYVCVDVIANAFLHHMVRNIVGTLLVVGKGEQKPAWVEEILAGRDRTLAGITAPAQGLYFLKVNYPAQYEFPDSTQGFEFFSS